MPLDQNPLLATFAELVDQDPEAMALIDGRDGAVCSRTELLSLGSAAAEMLRSSGVGPCEIVALRMHNSAAFVGSVLGCWSIGAAVVPLDRDARDPEIASVIRQFGARAFLWSEGSGRLQVRSENDSSPARLDRGVVLVKLSSGSSGVPKGILTTAKNLAADCGNIVRTMQIAPDDVNLGAIPFSHSYGFSNLVLPLLLRGTPVIYTNDYLPLSILELANRYRCSVLPGIPMMLDHLARLPASDGSFESLRTVISAGAPLSAGTSEAFRRRFGLEIHTFYGASECGGISYDREGGAVERGNVGSALDGVRLSVSPVHGTLVVESDAVALGYVHASADDDRKFTGGSFRTDDMATIDGQGTVRLEGRAGDLINIAGRKVNPREIEAVLLEMPQVREAKVYGEPAGARGEIVAAVVVAAPPLTREQIRSFCIERLSGFKVPRIIKFVDAIPVDERGKVRRAALRETAK